jgi:hypothetical protein
MDQGYLLLNPSSSLSVLDDSTKSIAKCLVPRERQVKYLVGTKYVAPGSSGGGARDQASARGPPKCYYLELAASLGKGKYERRHRQVQQYIPKKLVYLLERRGPLMRR